MTYSMQMLLTSPQFGEFTRGEITIKAPDWLQALVVLWTEERECRLLLFSGGNLLLSFHVHFYVLRLFYRLLAWATNILEGIVCLISLVYLNH